MVRVRANVMIDDKEERDYLKSLGINRSSFMRQAITKFKEGKFEYQYIEEVINHNL